MWTELLVAWVIVTGLGGVIYRTSTIFAGQRQLFLPVLS